MLLHNEFEGLQPVWGRSFIEGYRQVDLDLIQFDCIAPGSIAKKHKKEQRPIRMNWPLQRTGVYEITFILPKTPVVEKSKSLKKYLGKMNRVRYFGINEQVASRATCILYRVCRPHWFI